MKVAIMTDCKKKVTVPIIIISNDRKKAQMDGMQSFPLPPLMWWHKAKGGLDLYS